MNKLVVLIVFGLVGAGATILISFVAPNLLSAGTTLLTSLVTRAQDLVTWGQSNLTALIAGAGAIITPSYLLFNSLYQRAKTANKQEAINKVREAENTVLAEAKARVAAETQVIELKGQVEVLTKAQTSVSDLTATLERVESDKARLQSDLTAAQRLNNLVMHPTEDELIRKLQKDGFTVVKTVH